MTRRTTTTLVLATMAALLVTTQTGPALPAISESRALALAEGSIDEADLAVDEEAAMETYRLFQDHEEEIHAAVLRQLGDDGFAGIWLTRGTWEVNIGVVSGQMPEGGLVLPADGRLTYVFHDRGESLKSLQDRANQEGKRVDVRTGQVSVSLPRSARPACRGSTRRGIDSGPASF